MVYAPATRELRLRALCCRGACSLAAAVGFHAHENRVDSCEARAKKGSNMPFSISSAFLQTEVGAIAPPRKKILRPSVSIVTGPM